MPDPKWVTPNWDAPANIKAIMTTRVGGVSDTPYDSWNMGDHVDDDLESVQRNRKLLELAGIPSQPRWLQQVHGNRIVNIDSTQENDNIADGCVSKNAQTPCAVMTADCIPLLLTNQSGTTVAAIHCGWRGVVAGIAEQAIQAIADKPEEIIAWIGVGISQSAFQVGNDTRLAFLAADPCSAQFFVADSERKWRLDLAAVLMARLNKKGVENIAHEPQCSYSNPQTWFSHRYASTQLGGTTGRMAAVIWQE